MNTEEFFRVGERIYNLKRAFNFKHGMQRSEDYLPERLKEPLPAGGSKGSVAHLDQLIEKFYKLRGWDLRTGKPTKERLEQLGMIDIAKELWP